MGVLRHANDITDYPIIGFTNNDGTGDGFVGFRVWDDNLDANHGAWVNLPNVPVDYNGWNTLSIDFTGAAFVYFGRHPADRSQPRRIG